MCAFVLSNSFSKEIPTMWRRTTIVVFVLVSDVLCRRDRLGDGLYTFTTLNPAGSDTQSCGTATGHSWVAFPAP